MRNLGVKNFLQNIQRCRSRKQTTKTTLSSTEITHSRRRWWL